MPCWYYEKKELRNTPSLRDGIAAEVEARYRREGARLIIDCGTKLGLRYDTAATGVVYFHRFYMFHSFRQFHRYVTAACCLFLAGKVEETPKKCRDLFKIVRSILTESQFAVFGSDPREELMTLERILLQTIKFDLMVEHPYIDVLKFAKQLKGDAKKIESLVQMSWTFVNDSLCTNLCLQWESDIIAVSLMYLSSRLTKVELNDWQGKTPGTKAKWYDSLVPDVTLDIIEDVCHHVLDLYSKSPAQSSKEDSPPPPPPPPPKPATTASASNTPKKRSRSPSPVKPKKSSRQGSPATRGQSPPPAPPRTSTATNPYMTSQMFSSSFLSGEGSNAIQTLIGGQPRPANPQQYPAGGGKGQYPAGGGKPQYPAGAGKAQYPQGKYPGAGAAHGAVGGYPAGQGTAQYPATQGSGADSSSYASGTVYTTQPYGNTSTQYSAAQYSQQYAQYQQQYNSQQYQAPVTASSQQYPATTQSYSATSTSSNSQYTAPPPSGNYNSYSDRSYAQAVSGSGYPQSAGYSQQPGQQGGGYSQYGQAQGGGYGQYRGAQGGTPARAPAPPNQSQQGARGQARHQRR